MATSGVEVVKPLDPAAVTTTVAFAAKLPQFTAVERALRHLADRDKDWSLESLIIKVSALDSLYVTNLSGAVRMASWISEHLVPVAEWTTDTVETIAALPNEVEVSLGDLDCYLWLAGQWMVMQRSGGAAAVLGKEVTAAFKKETPEREAMVALLADH